MTNINPQSEPFQSVLKKAATTTFEKLTAQTFTIQCKSQADLIGKVSTHAMHLWMTNDEGHEKFQLYIEQYPTYSKYLSESHQLAAAIFEANACIKHHMMTRKKEINAELLEEINNDLANNNNCPWNTLQELYDKGMHACIFFFL